MKDILSEIGDESEREVDDVLVKINRYLYKLCYNIFAGSETSEE